ncbi:MAG: DUF5134 domain-containing protein [Actinocrinis sp.]
MNAPAWLPAVLAALVMAAAAFFLWRLAMAAAFERLAGADADAFYAAVAVALAGMLVRWARLLPPGAWAVLFALAALWFAARGARAHRGGEHGARDRSAFRAFIALVLVYMPLAGVAPSTLSGSTAGLFTMAGMPGMIVDTTERYPTLGLLLVAVVVGAAVVLIDRASAGARPAPDQDTAVDATEQLAAAPTPTPRLAAACRALLLFAIAYAILSKLV